QRDVEREGRKCRVAAEYSGGEKQTHHLTAVAAQRKPTRDDSHRKRPANIHHDRPVRKIRTEQRGAGQIDRVTQHRAESAADEDKKECKTAMTHCAISFVGVISLVGRLSGNPIPFGANLNTTDRSAHAHVLDFSIAACILRAYSDSIQMRIVTYNFL